MSKCETNEEDHFPRSFFFLYSAVTTTSAVDGFALLLHSILLEVGFRPKDVAEDETYKLMPKDWNSSRIFRIHYYHKDIPGIYTWVTCVPLLKNIAVQGTLLNETSDDKNVHTNILIDDYLLKTTDFSSPSGLFTNLKQLTKYFKDEFCFPLLAVIQQSVDYKPGFGLNGLNDDIMSSILKLLPVKDVMSLSGVNRNFHCQADSEDLWKFMYKRDYEEKSALVSCNNESWKELYKSEYLKKKRQQAFRPRARIHPTHYYPPLYPVTPTYQFDRRINMDPALQMAFPQMRSRFRRSDWPFAWDNRFHYYGRYW